MHATSLNSCFYDQFNRTLHRVAPYLVWPGLLALSGLFAVLLLSQGVETGTAYLSTFFFSLLCMGLLEAIAPFRKQWRANSKEWLSNGIYFLLNGLNGNLATLLAALLAIRLAPEQSDLPLAVAVPSAILLSSFVGYWWHRLGHEAALLWRFHGVHHVPGKIFMFNNNTVHAVDLFFGSVLTALPLLVLGFSELVVAIAAFFANFQGFFNHLNVNVRMGPLGYLFMGPEHHRFHHSQKVEEALNFSSEIALWDQLFGTFIYRPGGQPARIGIAQPHHFPEDTNPFQSFLHPFRN